MAGPLLGLVQVQIALAPISGPGGFELLKYLSDLRFALWVLTRAAPKEFQTRADAASEGPFGKRFQGAPLGGRIWNYQLVKSSGNREIAPDSLSKVSNPRLVPGTAPGGRR